MKAANQIKQRRVRKHFCRAHAQEFSRLACRDMSEPAEIIVAEWNSDPEHKPVTEHDVLMMRRTHDVDGPAARTTDPTPDQIAAAAAAIRANNMIALRNEKQSKSKQEFSFRHVVRAGFHRGRVIGGYCE